MKKLFLSVSLLLIFYTAQLPGQMVTKQAGIRGGYRSGFFYQFTRESGNAEVGYNAMLGFNNNGIQVTGLRIIYETALSNISPDLYFAWGYGGHVGFIYTDHIRYFGERYSFQGNRFSPVAGVDGWLAAEYRFRDVPINVGLSLKPFVELTMPSFVKIMPFDIGLSVSYVF
jgi:hypothetical protein